LRACDKRRMSASAAASGDDGKTLARRARGSGRYHAVLTRAGSRRRLRAADASPWPDRAAPAAPRDARPFFGVVFFFFVFFFFVFFLFFFFFFFF